MNERQRGDVRFHGDGASVHLGSVLLWADRTRWDGIAMIIDDEGDFAPVRAFLHDRERIIAEFTD